MKTKLSPKDLTYQIDEISIRWLGVEQQVEISGNLVWCELCSYELSGLFKDPVTGVTERRFTPEKGNEWLPQIVKIWEKDPVTYRTELNQVLTKWGLEIAEDFTEPIPNE